MISLSAFLAIVLMMITGVVGGVTGGTVVVIASLWLLGRTMIRGDDD